MQKELTITVIIIFLVIVANIITQKNTDDTVEIIDSKLVQIKKNILANEEEQINKQIDEIEKIWEDEYKKLAYYIEHDELEKVKTELVKLKANIQVEEYQQAVENLDTGSYILKHIQDKNAIKIINIF